MMFSAKKRKTEEKTEMIELAKIFIRATVNKNNYLNSIDYINDFLNEE
mgnify:CR=1 FL=1